jgi:nicotinamide riboside kinase
MAGSIFAVLGAESTGKTTLTAELVRILRDRGQDAVLVTEYLREVCDRWGRTPTMLEQTEIADEQSRRISQAASEHAVVIADTTAVMTAVYSDLIFGDTSLYPQAEQAHAAVRSTLLTSLDLAWMPDGLQRDGPHVREAVDTLVRQSLCRMDVPFAVVAGQGIARIQHGLSHVEHLLDTPQRQTRAAASPKWRWFCERCDDGECEQHWLKRG